MSLVEGLFRFDVLAGKYKQGSKQFGAFGSKLFCEVKFNKHHKEYDGSRLFDLLIPLLQAENLGM